MKLNKIDRVLIEFEKGRKLTARVIKTELGIKPNTFHKAIETLADEGYEIAIEPTDTKEKTYSLVKT